MKKSPQEARFKSLSAKKTSSRYNVVVKMLNNNQSPHDAQNNNSARLATTHSPSTLNIKSKLSKSKRLFDPYEVIPTSCKDYIWLVLYYVGLYTFFAAFWFVCWYVYLTTLPEGRPRYMHNKTFSFPHPNISESTIEVDHNNYSSRSSPFMLYNGSVNPLCNNSI